MRHHPWASTPVGPVEQWPFSLKLAVRTLLDCRLPMALAWGDGHTQFFNDACVPVLGTRTQEALGRDARATWRDVRHAACSTSPVYGDAGRPEGVLATFVETADTVPAERRRAFQAGLADILRRATASGPQLQAALGQVGAYVGGATVTYADVKGADDAAVIVEQWDDGARTAQCGRTVPLAQLALAMPARLRAGETVWSAGANAGVAVPLLDGDRLAAVLALDGPLAMACDADEIRLLEDAAHRIWDALRRLRAEEALHEEMRVLELMKGASETLASTIALEPLLQAITDAATQLVGAQSGSFFYNGEDDNGDTCMVTTLSGASCEPVAALGLPRPAAVAGPTFHGNAPIRSDDIRTDPRYGTMAPQHGMPPGHLPIVSCLAASVVSRSGEVIGDLFFGHSKAAMFSERSEELIGAFAVQAAIAIDNARLYDMAQRAAREREQLLASERAARAEAERHNKMKDEFLAMLAHELRNPLAPITSAAQLLRLPEVNEGLRLKASNIISRQVRHMTELVDDLLDVSRVTRGLVKLENEVLDLNKVAMAAVEQARPHIEERRHGLTVDLPDAPVPVEGDRTRLIQVLVNLLNNSAKYTPAGGRIHLAVTRAGNETRVAVRDNGSGIDAQLLPHVFDLFTQADRAPDRSQGGLGIGLALVKSIVRMHNGQVAAHSDGPQRGTLMTVALPLAHAEVGQVVRSGEGSGEAHPLTVTIVDDNADAGHSLAVLLRAHGHTVHVHEDAADTLARADPATEVFILDIGLPDMTGYELARRLRRDTRHAHAVHVALTGYGQPRDRELSKQAGFDHHLVKPVEIGKLAQILAAKAERKADAAGEGM